MTGPALEPYALQQTWSMPRPLAGTEWRGLFCEYLATLARACTSAAAVSGSAVLIGHIKLLALFGEGQYLRVSVVSQSHRLTVTGEAPDALAEVKTTLNVLVYGLAAAKLAELTSAAADEVVGRWGATVQEEEPDRGGHDRSPETRRVSDHHHHVSDEHAD